MQRTLESLFELASFLLVLLYPRPEQFPTLSALSYLVVLGAAVVFSSFACGEYVGTLQEVGLLSVRWCCSGNGGDRRASS